jgi:hypothetical protein
MSLAEERIAAAADIARGEGCAPQDELSRNFARLTNAAVEVLYTRQD